MDNENKKLQIDTQQMFKEKNLKLYNTLPAPFFKYLKRITHEKDVNDVLFRLSGKTGIDFLAAVLEDFKVEGKITGIENLPDNSNLIFAANHPLGSMDGLLLIKTVYDKYGKAKALVNDMLMKLEPLQEFFVGFNKHGAVARETIKELNNLLEGDSPIIYFPSGMVSRKAKGEIQDPDWRKTFINNACKYHRSIIPTHISGHLSSKFYRAARLRKMLGIKKNLEMLYLPDETFKLKKVSLTLSFGKPIEYSKFDKSKTPAQWAEEVRKFVYRLPNDINADF